ncbi:nucleoside hydrolase [Paractinoplanes atraurantiacus]|uniref:Purine nucleosidase n=1 Tax=Paractinoplanes atraurantiacus TaxID=1036182 RepID=A0A285IFW1_9ACTN|nr:nucleoside hydrolase [Actinoplanes atraurantiacus]SNY45831.1 purine nucleosidase [Actinoplanes atraurantiacus]
MIFYLDCDTGIDDAIAIAYLLAHPAVRLAGIGTVNGNTAAGQAARNTLGLLALAGRDDIPVAVGEGEIKRGAKAVHGGNGVGGVVLPEGGRPDPRTSVEMLLDLSREYAGELHLLATGPCTNLALALRADPTLPERIKTVTIMGGAVRVPGNVTPRAEANIGDDPASAGESLRAAWPVTLVPLDVTLQHRWSEQDRASLGATPLTAALAGMLPAYLDFYEDRTGSRAVPLHDPLAAAIAVGEIEPTSSPGLALRVGADGHISETGDKTVTVVLAAPEGSAGVLLRRINGISGSGIA